MLNRTKEYLDLINEDALFPDDFDEALIGFVEGASRMPVALYDSDKCIRILIERDGTVSRKKHRQSLEEDEIKNIITLIKEGKEVKVISKLLDLAESTVYRYRREANK